MVSENDRIDKKKPREAQRPLRQPQEEISNLRIQARVHLAKGELQESLDVVQQALELKPDDSVTLKLRDSIQDRIAEAKAQDRADEQVAPVGEADEIDRLSEPRSSEEEGSVSGEDDQEPTRLGTTTEIAPEHGKEPTKREESSETTAPDEEDRETQDAVDETPQVTGEDQEERLPPETVLPEREEVVDARSQPATSEEPKREEELDSPPLADADTELVALARAVEIPLQHIQKALKDLGYLSGLADGKLGPATREAILRYQGAMGYPKTGEMDDRQRVSLIEAAASAGHPRSQNTLGIMNAEGIGKPVDPARAAHWFQAAADQGDPYGAYNLAILYRNGNGIERSIERARHYFSVALAGNHPKARKALDDLNDVDKQEQADAPAISPLSRAREIPNQLIQQALKDLGYLKGKADGVIGPLTTSAIDAFQRTIGSAQTGTLTNRQRVALVRAAAEAGHPGSQNTLGMMAGAGIGVPQNDEEAARWFTASANQGDSYGAYNLAILYRDGRGVERSIEMAERHLRSAAANGHPQAQKTLKELRE